MTGLPNMHSHHTALEQEPTCIYNTFIHSVYSHVCTNLLVMHGLCVCLAGLECRECRDQGGEWAKEARLGWEHIRMSGPGASAPSLAEAH